MAPVANTVDADGKRPGLGVEGIDGAFREPRGRRRRRPSVHAGTERASPMVPRRTVTGSQVSNHDRNHTVAAALQPSEGRRPFWTDRAPRREQPDRYCAVGAAGERPGITYRISGAMGVPASHPSRRSLPAEFPPGSGKSPPPTSHPFASPATGASAKAVDADAPSPSSSSGSTRRHRSRARRRVSRPRHVEAGQPSMAGRIRTAIARPEPARAASHPSGPERSGGGAKRLDAPLAEASQASHARSRGDGSSPATRTTAAGRAAPGPG